MAAGVLVLLYVDLRMRKKPELGCSAQLAQSAGGVPVPCPIGQ
jgi:hypothetical protein